MVDESNVVVLKTGQPPGPKRRVLRRSGCQHLHCTIDEEAHEVMCDDCQKVIDAFTILVCYANEEKRAFYDLKLWQQETQHLRKEAEELKREIRNLKAQRRRLVKG